MLYEFKDPNWNFSWWKRDLYYFIINVVVNICRLFIIYVVGNILLDYRKSFQITFYKIKSVNNFINFQNLSYEPNGFFFSLMNMSNDYK